ncbi:signal peptidase I [Enterocloster clostridioformis]|uniref:signal peptidase I n=1 Tax=Enterocloster clostridioformis TaxID=1531 RepID=UPI00267755B0|nr:signal peptidase I [Enterocloster clostridioformis]
MVVMNMGLAVLAALWISNYYRLAAVSGSSMEPALSQGDIVVVRMGTLPQRGDVVLIDSKVLHKRIIKRVIAVEGDTVFVSDGEIWVNGEVLVEEYIKEPYEHDKGVWVVPPESVYVLGDNRNHSRDSRVVGFIPIQEVTGTVMYPKNKFGGK